MDLSIAGDELEQHRIALEHNLMHTADFSLHLSSDDIEYPRHASHPSLDSFSHIARPHPDVVDDDDDADNSHYHHGWSYRTADDDDQGPYAGETLSTAAHHASALTLSAGLGGRMQRRDVSLSGAEYDPDRPITNIINNMADRFSVLDIDSTRSRNITNVLSTTYDPLVLDTSTELDHIPLPPSLRSPPPTHSHRQARFRSPTHSSSTSSVSSRPSTPLSPGTRPKLSDTLNSTFSPKRPKGSLPTMSPAAAKVRGPLPTQFEMKRAEKQTPAKPKASRKASSRTIRPPAGSEDDEDVETARERDGREAPTPHARKSYNSRPDASISMNKSFGGQSLSYAAEPEVHVLPPTPPTTDLDRSPGNTLNFSQKIKSGSLNRVTKELEERARRSELGDDTFEGAPVQSTVREKKRTSSKSLKGVREGFTEKSTHFIGDLTSKSLPNHSKSRIHLPDVTGLTAAIASPAPPGRTYPSIKLSKSDPIDTRLITALSSIQSKLVSLEKENGISRRRVRELEVELDVCREEVRRERGRVVEREEEVSRELRAVREREERRAREWEEERKRGREEMMERERGWERERRKREERDRERDRERKERRKKNVGLHVASERGELEADRLRYMEAVEEKKALESLLTTLRSHLSRLTSELQSHSQLLSQLKELRETDAAALREKAAEVERLGKAVERLEGEVVVLRGVVEEGLRERREKEGSRILEDQFINDAGPSRKPLVEDISESESESEEEDETDDEHDGARLQRSPSRRGHNVRIVSTPMAEKTMRTDCATAGSTPSGVPTPGALGDGDGDADVAQLEAELETSQVFNSHHGRNDEEEGQGFGSQFRREQERTEPFISRTELTRISEEVEERRSERSRLSAFSARSSSRAGGSERGDISLRAEVGRVMGRASSRAGSVIGPRAGSRAGSVVGSRAGSRAGSVSSDEGEETEKEEDMANKGKRKGKSKAMPASNVATVGAGGYHDYSSSSTAPPAERAPSPAHSAAPASRRHRKPSDPSRKTSHPQLQPQGVDDTPFPQIRGPHMERLFFSAPEHDARTCTVCHRRRRSTSSAPLGRTASWGPEYARRACAEQWDLDEVLHFVKGKDKDKAHPCTLGRSSSGAADGPEDRAPPQTVLARVLRELEDDFSHYKSIYTELAEQYRVIDAVSNVAKRNVLAGHLREVIGLLEQKGDQIASLYDLLTFKDKPVAESAVPGPTKRGSRS